MVCTFCGTAFLDVGWFFVSTERKYRSLYDDVRKLNESQTDFSMNTDAYKAIGLNDISMIINVHMSFLKKGHVISGFLAIYVMG